MSMFDNYPQPAGYVPNNRPLVCEDNIPNIIIGSNVTHTFDVPYNIMTDLKELEVIYKQGLNVVLTKDRADLSYQIVDAHQSIIASKLTPIETLKFEDTFMTTEVQLKFYFNDNTIDYSTPMKIYVFKALDY